MKTKIIIVLCLFMSTASVAQNEINYKALIKDNLGNVVSNESITIQFNILEGVAMTLVYTERQNPLTDANGIIIVNIGEGSVQSGVYSDISWSSHDHFLNVQIDIDGNGLVDMGTSKFAYVPYAINANTASNVKGLEAIDEGNGIGWRIIGRDPSHYGNIGNEATDFSLSGVPSTVFGATGFGSFASGVSTKASGGRSTAMGLNTEASGESSIALGNSTIASGDYTTAMGLGTTASGNYSTALGFNTTASGLYSFVGGNGTDANGESSFAFGEGALADNPYTFALGFESEATGDYAIAMGFQTQATNTYAVALGHNTNANGNAAFAVGSNSSASGDYSFAAGSTIASGNGSAAFGVGNQALGNNSLIFGSTNIASGNSSLVGGFLSTASGLNSTALGLGSTASGQNAFAIGHGSNSGGLNTFTSGFDTLASGNHSTAMGVNTQANSYAGIAIGRYNVGGGNFQSWVSTDPVFEIGNGTADNDRRNAFTVYKDGDVMVYGKIGVGTTLAPNIPIEVYGGSEALLNSGTGKLLIGGESFYNLIFDEDEIQARFSGTASHLLLQPHGGTLSIGTNNPELDAKVQIANGFDVEDDNNAGFLVIGHTNSINIGFDNNEIQARDNGSAATLFLQQGGGSVAVNGAIVHTSDRRLKKDITELSYGLKDVLKLNPVTYYWKNKPNQNHKSLGLIAQELQEIISEVVSEENNKEKTLYVNYTELIPVLIKAIKEQQEIISNQELKINTLSTELSDLDDLESRIEQLENLIKISKQ